MNLANKITLARIVLIPVFLIVLLMPNVFGDKNYIIATIIFIIASLTDALDGYIARSRNLVTDFGKFADPLADKLLVTSALICLVFTQGLDPVSVIIILSREFIITGFRTVAVTKNIVIAASIWGKIKTNIQVIMVIYFLLRIQDINATTKIVGQAIVIVTVVATIFSAVDYMYKNKEVISDM